MVVLDQHFYCACFKISLTAWHSHSSLWWRRNHAVWSPLHHQHQILHVKETTSVSDMKLDHRPMTHVGRTRYEPSLLPGFLLNKALSRDWASTLRNWGIPRRALQGEMDGTQLKWFHQIHKERHFEKQQHLGWTVFSLCKEHSLQNQVHRFFAVLPLKRQRSSQHLKLGDRPHNYKL